MQQPANRKDGIFFAIALSELTGKPVHGYLKYEQVDGEPSWNIETTFCYLPNRKVMSINGVCSKEELEATHKGMIKLTTNNREHLLDFVNDPVLEKNLDVLVSNYKEAILDTYGQDLIGTITNSRSSNDSEFT